MQIHSWRNCDCRSSLFTRQKTVDDGTEGVGEFATADDEHDRIVDAVDEQELARVRQTRLGHGAPLVVLFGRRVAAADPVGHRGGRVRQTEDAERYDAADERDGGLQF